MTKEEIEALAAAMGENVSKSIQNANKEVLDELKELNKAAVNKMAAANIQQENTEPADGITKDMEKSYPEGRNKLERLNASEFKMAEVGNSRIVYDPNRGFNNFADFMYSAAKAYRGGVTLTDREKLLVWESRESLERIKAAATPSLVIGNDVFGGMQVPEGFSTRMLKTTMEKSKIIPLCDVEGTEFYTENFPQYQDYTRVNDVVSGGVRAYFTYEGAEVTKTVPKTENLKFEMKKIEAETAYTNEMKHFAKGFDQATIMANIGSAFSLLIDSKIFRGANPGVISGLLTRTAAIKTLARETAATITYNDAIGLISLIRDAYLSSPSLRWIAHQTTRKYLKGLILGNNTTVSLMETRNGIDYLDGVPILWSGKAATLGNESDLFIADLFQYMIRYFGKQAAPEKGIENLNLFTYAATGQETIKVYGFLDGQLKQTSTFTDEQSSEFASVAVLTDAAGE